MGQLGDGSGKSSATPVQVAGDLVFTSITAGEYHTCGLLINGSGACWGCVNFIVTHCRSLHVHGQCMLFKFCPMGAWCVGGATTSHTVACCTCIARAWCPDTSVAQYQGVTLFPSHTCRLNLFGQLGDGTTSNRATPTLIPGIEFKAVDSGPSAYHTLFIA